MQTEDLIKKYDINVPRYTSYPTANHFSEDVSVARYQAWLKTVPRDASLSIYLHIPFCEKMCRYCGCHTRILEHYEPARDYVDALRREIETVSFLLGGRRKAAHIHWGGGTPTFLHGEDIAAIMETLHGAFGIDGETEHAIEIDPRTLDENKAEFLAGIGVTRASLGVQDFNSQVQKAIDRIQPFELVRDNVSWLRRAGIEAVNFDMIYGLPLQTPETIRQTMELALTLSPDRLAVFGYAHVPWFKKQQEQLEAYGLPDALERYHLYRAAADILTKAGYREIGIDHFTAPGDSMSKAYEQGRLHRNFQGYTTDNSDVLLGFGASAITSLPKGYVQNSPMIKEYREKTSAGLLATSRGAKKKSEDRPHHSVIEKIMCYGRADFSMLDEQARKAAHERLAPLVKNGIAVVRGDHVSVTEKGRIFTRLVCTAFDAYWQKSNTRHAKAV
jgi:oxygen-independent coproporphyrinogen-3 oxidase